jgi:hypothetical protein
MPDLFERQARNKPQPVEVGPPPLDTRHVLPARPVVSGTHPPFTHNPVLIYRNAKQTNPPTQNFHPGAGPITILISARLYQASGSP